MILKHLQSLRDRSGNNILVVLTTDDSLCAQIECLKPCYLFKVLLRNTVPVLEEHGQNCHNREYPLTSCMRMFF